MRYGVDHYESVFSAAIESSLNMLVPYFLSASYLYYIRDESLFSDALYDAICEALRENFDDLEHRHKHVIDRDALMAGTAFTLKAEDYPTMLTHAATSLAGIPWIDHKGITSMTGRAPSKGSPPHSNVPKSNKFTIIKKAAQKTVMTFGAKK